MKSLSRSVVSLALPALLGAALLCGSEHDAHALGPIDIEAGAKIGVASNPVDGGANPFGFGLGARGGVGIFGLYAGLSAIHYFGNSSTLQSTKIDYSSTLLGGEIGYTIKLIPLLKIRPQLGLGNATFFSKEDSSGNGTSSKQFYLEPGVVGLISLGLLYVGADVNALIIPGVDQGDNTSKTYTSLTIHGQIGIQF